MEKGLCGALTGGCMHPIAPQQTRLCQYEPLPTNDDGGNNNNNNQQQQQQQDDTPAQEDQQQDDTPIATGDGSSSSSDAGSDGSSIEDLFDVCKRSSSYPAPPMFSRPPGTTVISRLTALATAPRHAMRSSSCACACAMRAGGRRLAAAETASSPRSSATCTTRTWPRCRLQTGHQLGEAQSARMPVAPAVH